VHFSIIITFFHVQQCQSEGKKVNKQGVKGIAAVPKEKED